jgi:hypothetical protein
VTNRLELQTAWAKKRFRCPRGHEQLGEYRVHMHGPNGLSEAKSGPICRRCYFERLVSDCETVEIPEGQ